MDITLMTFIICAALTVIVMVISDLIKDKDKNKKEEKGFDPIVVRMDSILNSDGLTMEQKDNLIKLLIDTEWKRNIIYKPE